MSTKEKENQEGLKGINPPVYPVTDSEDIHDGGISLGGVKRFIIALGIFVAIGLIIKLVSAWLQ